MRSNVLQRLRGHVHCLLMGAALGLVYPALVYQYRSCRSWMRLIPGFRRLASMATGFFLAYVGLVGVAVLSMVGML